MLQRTIPLIATLSIGAGSALFAGGAAHATGAPDAAKTTPTAYALQAFGYGSRVKGGQVPTSSDRSAFQAIGCTNLAGLDKTNAESTLHPSGDLTLAGVRTHVWTDKTGTAVSSWASHSIAKVTLVDTSTSHLYLRGVTSTSHSWHNRGGFAAKTTTDIGSIVLNSGGVRSTFPVPTAGNSVNIPGVATVSLGKGSVTHGRHFAAAFVDAVRLHAAATDTVTYLAHSSTTIQDGVKSALFHGSAYGTKADLANGRATSGPTPLLLMPCQGTNGKILHRSINRVHLGNQTNARSLSTSQRARVTAKGADAFERSAVTTTRLAGGLRITGVVARAHVTKTGSRYTKDAKGTSTGKIYLNNRRVQIPASGVLRLRGVAKIESNLVNRSAHGIDVTALQVTLLDGSSSVVDIAHAEIAIRPSGL